MQPFGPPNTIISDNASCFSAMVVKKFVKNQGITWKSVLAYVPMSNGRAERMMGTLKKSIGRIFKRAKYNKLL